MPPPLVLVNAVGLTPRLLPLALRLHALAKAGWVVPLRETLPAVTCTAQATMLTGQAPEKHGVVGNGWLYRDTGEVRFWQQSNRLIQAEPFYATARRRAAARGRPFKSAKLFWWFNQGAAVDLSVTPKPHYGIDGNKVFGIHGTPEELTGRLERTLGPFPFATFWGPMAGLPCTQWIAAAAACVLLDDRPDLTLVYLPHLDYDPQRFGPSGCDMAKLVRELDDACGPLLDAAKAVGARVWVVSEYGHCDVSRPVYLNRVLRKAGLLAARPGPFGEQPDTFNSRTLAVCDHQVAHVYVADLADVPRVRELLAAESGVARVLAGEERNEVGLRHQRSGELVILSEPKAWFAYPFWLNDAVAPDYARTVAIHHKPGYDPCELFFDPDLRFPKLRVVRKLLQKKLGFRMRMDVVPLDATIVKGSHGLPATTDVERPLCIGDGPRPGDGTQPMALVHDWVLAALDLSEVN
ncbi:MAG TPA: alkaline phosphatase family protein [Gemmataceae bacterium]|nr:alkaline phosphatase family protein [Gemmataceae bacterium]